MTTEPLPEIPEEITVTEARMKFSELVEAASTGKVIHLTKRGERVAALVPEDSRTELDHEFMAIGAQIREHYREMFDKLAEL